MRAGGSPVEFWQLTPWQTRQCFIAYGQAAEDRFRAMATVSYMNAGLSRYPANKRLPELKTLLSAERKPTSGAEIAQMLKMRFGSK